VHVRHNSYDFHRLRIDADADVLADRVLTVWIFWPQAMGQAFVDHGYGRRARAVVFRKFTSSPQRNLQCPEVFWRDVLDNPRWAAG